MVIADLVDTLSRIGAIGGILSIIGVGLLILLVASQNRQIRSMREWIDEEPQRQQEVAQRVIAEVQRRIAAARERRSGVPAVPVPEVPLPVPGAPRPPAPGTLGATPEAQAIAAGKELVPPGPAAPTENAEGGATPPGGPDAPKFAPLTPAGGADTPEGSVPPPATPADDEPAVVSEFLNQETQVADALPDDPPLAAASNRAEPRYSDEHFDLEDEPREGGSRVLFGVGVAALLAGIVIAGFVLFGGGSDEKQPSGSADNGSQTEPPAGGGNEGGEKEPAASTPTVDRSTVNVRVLNGTSISGLAQRVSDDLKNKGYGPDRPDTFTGAQTVTVTSVEYRPGKKAAASAVAEDLGLPSSSVKAIDADLSVAAGESADVVVLTGSDMDSSASATTAE